MRHENLNPISKWDDVGNNMLKEMEEEAKNADREWKAEKYQKIVEEGLGSEDVWDEWNLSDMQVMDFIKMLYKREGRMFIKVIT